MFCSSSLAPPSGNPEVVGQSRSCAAVFVMACLGEGRRSRMLALLNSDRKSDSAPIYPATARNPAQAKATGVYGIWLAIDVATGTTRIGTRMGTGFSSRSPLIVNVAEGTVRRWAPLAIPTKP